jgi:hypothetical protein
LLKLLEHTDYLAIDLINMGAKRTEPTIAISTSNADSLLYDQLIPFIRAIIPAAAAVEVCHTDN